VFDSGAAWGAPSGWKSGWGTEARKRKHMPVKERKNNPTIQPRSTLILIFYANPCVDQKSREKNCNGFKLTKKKNFT
jgi:hypothetical protein